MKLWNQQAVDFVRESNRIEGILREPTGEELDAHDQLIRLREVRIPDLEAFVFQVQPDAALRSRAGLNVRVGRHRPPPGGPDIPVMLEAILQWASRNYDPPHQVHCAYENLHPFTDGNGRSGRALWAWQMIRFGISPGVQLGFLHAFYYQTLEARR